MLKKKIDIYSYSKEYCKLLKTHQKIFEEYQKSRINIHEQPTKDCDIELDALIDIELILKNYRIKELSQSFNIKSIGLLILKKINELKKTYGILNTNISEELKFSFSLGNIKLDLEYKYEKIQLRNNDILLYYFDCISLNEYFTLSIKEIIPQINWFDIFNINNFMKKIIKYLLPHLLIEKKHLTSFINIKAYDILDKEEFIRKATIDKLPVIFDFSYLIDNRPTTYSQISNQEREKIKKKWLNLFSTIDWNTSQFIQLNNIYSYLNNIDEIFYNHPHHYAKFYHYNMFFLMILMRSYNEQKEHIVNNIFAKFLLFFYHKKDMIEIDKSIYQLNDNDKYELNDDFFSEIDHVYFFPDERTVNFFTENNVKELKESYQEFIKNLKSIKKFKRENIDLII